MADVGYNEETSTQNTGNFPAETNSKFGAKPFFNTFSGCVRISPYY